MRTAYRSIRQNVVLAHGLEGTCRGLDAISATAMISFRAERSALEAWREEAMAGGVSCAVVHRHHDATPLLLRFGALQDAVFPHATYLVLIWARTF